jgi:hypothetical protein
MEKHPCQQLREKLIKCREIEGKVIKCDVLCMQNDDLTDCKLFLKAMQHLLEKKDKE